jgi:hypothetical protein
MNGVPVKQKIKKRKMSVSVSFSTSPDQLLGISGLLTTTDGTKAQVTFRNLMKTEDGDVIGFLVLSGTRLREVLVSSIRSVEIGSPLKG